MSRCLLLCCVALGLISAELQEPAATRLAGIRLRVPAGLVQVAGPPTAALATWRSEDGLVALAVVERTAPDAAALAEQIAALQELGQDVVIETNAAAPTGPWHHLRYQITLGPTRFVQEARIATLPGAQGERQLVVTASWPLELGERWDAELVSTLDALALE